MSSTDVDKLWTTQMMRKVMNLYYLGAIATLLVAIIVFFALIKKEAVDIYIGFNLIPFKLSINIKKKSNVSRAKRKKQVNVR